MHCFKSILGRYKYFKKLQENYGSSFLASLASLKKRFCFIPIPRERIFGIENSLGFLWKKKGQASANLAPFFHHFPTIFPTQPVASFQERMLHKRPSARGMEKSVKPLELMACTAKGSRFLGHGPTQTCRGEMQEKHPTN